MLHFESHAQDVGRLIQAALAAVDPAAAVRRELWREGNRLFVAGHEFKLARGRLFMAATGKAAVSMGVAAAQQVGDLLAEGIFVTKNEPAPEQLPARCRLFYGSHPVSDEKSIGATAAVTKLAQQARDGDLFLCLLSGGTSALLTQPMLPLPQWQALNDFLLASGCTILEFNEVRRRLDRVKGGGLARMAAPATCVTLILSDVVGNPLDLIGSGPTVPHSGTAAAALAVLQRYDAPSRLEPALWQAIEHHLAVTVDDVTDVPEQLVASVIGDVRLAAETAVAEAGRLGFAARLLSTYLEGEAREVGRVVAALAKEAAAGSEPACLVLGGETTVTLDAAAGGQGGRNQELALAAAIALAGWPNVAVAAFATDGDDGPTGAAGAVVTGETDGRARGQGLDPLRYLDRHDSFTFFSRAGGLIQTGPTGTNVNDLVIMLTYGSR
jgi:glycerate 2-kinase